jgi:NAD(P)-dependent dehydrogenase (short-subunit alcohol dehydrogenase family)
MEQRRRAEREALSGQVAVVTGGGRGVGRAVAQRLAAARASVVLAARTKSEIDVVARTIEQAGGRALAVQTDVTDQEQVDRLMRMTQDEVGVPTLLVNNAGTWSSVGPVEASDAVAWWSDVEVSLKGTFLCTRALLPYMLERGRGRIVNLASRAGTVPRPNASGYAAAKAAVLSFTESVAAEVGSQGVSVFVISPGFVRTALIDGIAASDSGRAFLPDLATRSDELDPVLAADLVVDIASGRLDPLSGRYLHVLDDLDALLAEVRGSA